MDKNSHDYNQLQKDAERSLSTMKTFETITKFHLETSKLFRKKKQEAVLAVLDSFFAKNPELKYIQGFHDVASVFLILFGNSSGYYLMETAGRTYFYDFLIFDFGEVGLSVSKIIYELVTSQDTDFEKIFSFYSTNQLLIFIVPWILTWFSHNFSSVKTICRVWDYLLCTGPHGVFYFTAGIILSTKCQLLESCSDFEEPSIQTFYQEQAKSETINTEEVIQTALEIETKIEVSSLNGYKSLNENSMFRTENFKNKISIHTKFHEKRKKEERKQRNIKMAVKAVAIIGLTLAVFISGKQLISHQSNLKSIIEL